VIIGENRTFDHLFATYVPRSKDLLSNLLSKQIIKADGSPGKNFAKAGAGEIQRGGLECGHAATQRRPVKERSDQKNAQPRDSDDFFPNVRIVARQVGTLKAWRWLQNFWTSMRRVGAVTQAS
jgi:hypothetical protein